MFLGNPSLRGEGEKVAMTEHEIEEYIKCKNDIIYFAEHYFYIQTIDEGRKIIQLWDFQKKLLKAFQTPGNNKRHVCLLSARQMSKSTTASIYFCWKLLFDKDSTFAILANKEATAQEILSRIQMAYENFPLWLQKGVKEWNKKSLTLENNVKIIAGSTSSNSIRGFSISELLLDEAAFIQNGLFETFWNSILPTISSGKKSKIIIVSTPNGLNHFYNIYKDAVEGRNDFYPIKITWKSRPDRDEAWAERTRMNMSEKNWRQEFGCIFAGSSNTLVDGDVLENIITKPPIDYKYGTSFTIYEKPKDGCQYIVSVDPAKGTSDDYSTIQVLRIDHLHSLEQVAIYRNNTISPDNFCQIIIGVSDYYNKSYIMIENNDIGSLVCDKVFYEYECDRLLNCDVKGLGIRATKKTKLEGNMLLKEYIENGWLKINDYDTIKELGRYTEISPNVFHAAGQNENDDTVTALVWGLYYLKTPFYDTIENGRSDVKSVDKKYQLDEEKPIFFSSNDFSYNPEYNPGYSQQNYNNFSNDFDNFF